MHREVQRISFGARDWRLPSIEGWLGSTDPLADASWYPFFQLYPSSIECIVQSAFAERYVPEVVTNTFTLQGREGVIDVSKIPLSDPVH
jgi:hypothetical protein